jgi:hypothetical protein
MLIGDLKQTPVSESMKFIFVGGCGRSGTSLVQKILSSHSKITGGPEFDHTRDIFLLYKKMASDDYLKRQSFFYSANDLKKKYRNFYESFFEDAFYTKKNAIYLSEKTPVNIAVADVLLDIFPEAVFISVIRDGRDVLASHKDVKKRAINRGFKGIEWTPIGISNLWNFTMNKHFQLLNTPSLSKRIYVIKFENLVINPSKELSRLFGFLDIDLEKELLHPENITKVDTEKLIDDIWYTPEMYRQKFNSKKIGRWRTDLNFFDKLISNTMISKNLKEAKYDVRPEYLTLGKACINPMSIKFVRFFERKLGLKLNHHLYT